MTTWAPMELGPIIAGEVEIELPLHMRRSDGVALGYPNKQHSIYAEPEAGKSWLAARCAAHEITVGQHVVVIDFEDVPSTWIERLRALGVSDDELRTRFHYVQPEEPISDKAWEEIDPALQQASIVVIDGTNEGLALHGLNLNDNADVARWFQIPRRCQRYGAGVWQIDHVTKDRENRGRYAIGAQAKLAAVDVAYSLRVLEPFGRGRDGLVAIKVEKDRAGYVRAHQEPGGRIALMRLTSKENGQVGITLDPPEGASAAFRPTVLMERISRAIEDEPGITKRALRDAVVGNSSAKDLALQLLITEKFVSVTPAGSAHTHHSRRPFRDDAAGDRDQGVPTHRDHRDQACPSRAPTVTGERDHRDPVFIDGARGTAPSTNGHRDDEPPPLVAVFGDGEEL